MLDERVNSVLVVVTALLWIGVTVLGLTGAGFAALFVSLGILLAYALQGMARNGAVPARVLVYPIIPWIVLWALGFALSRYHADVYAGGQPDFTVLGFHPSFAWTVLLYWIGGVLTLSIGFVVRRDDWLSEDDWEAFKKKVGAAPETDGATADGEEGVS